jgi:hypothetical protein
MDRPGSRDAKRRFLWSQWQELEFHFGCFGIDPNCSTSWSLSVVERLRASVCCRCDRHHKRSYFLRPVAMTRTIASGSQSETMARPDSGSRRTPGPVGGSDCRVGMLRTLPSSPSRFSTSSNDEVALRQRNVFKGLSAASAPTGSAPRAATSGRGLPLSCLVPAIYTRRGEMREPNSHER